MDSELTGWRTVSLHCSSFSRVRQYLHLVHAPTLPSAAVTANASQSTFAGSRPGTPPRDAGTPSGVGTPNGGMNKDGTVLLDCVGCGRPVRATSCHSSSPTPQRYCIGRLTTIFIILCVDGF